jgi:hypothetical protein
MPINVDLSKTDRPGSAGEFQRVAAGPCHLLVTETKENGGKNGEHLVKMEVLMHSDQSQIGATHTEYYPATPEMAWKLLTFCYAAKIADREAMERAKQTGTDYVPIDLKAAEGRQLFGTIKVTEKDGKSFHNLDGLMSVDDPKAQHHPRNAGMLAQATKGVAGSGSQASPPSTTKPPATQAAAANPFAAVT